MIKPRVASGFTIVEILIVVVVLATLSSILVVGYGNIQARARETVARSELQAVSTAMQLAYIEEGEYPAEVPESLQSSSNVTLTMKWSGTFTSYGTLTPVQNGVLLAQTCQQLISEGLGRGVNQGGQTQNYITGCGNWNRGSMQVTAWSSRVWNTPVSSTQLLNYANTFTSGDTWNASQVPVVKNFYIQLVERHTSQGGTFPVTTFWDSWATINNGGTMIEALPATPQTKTTYCVEAEPAGLPDKRWHIGEEGTIKQGACQQA